MIYTGSDGVTKFSTKQTPKYKYKKANQFGTFWSDVAPPSNVGFVSEAMAAKSEKALQPFIDKFGIKLLNKMAQSQYGKNFKDLDRNNELKFFKKQITKYEDFILENRRYPNTAEAYNIGLQQGGKKKSRAQLLTDDVKKTIKQTYSSGEGGSTYISKKLAKQGVDIDASTIRRYITEEVEAGRIVRPKKFKTQEATAPKDRYNLIREVTPRDKRGFTVGSIGKKVLAPAWSNYKISFNTPRNPETTLVPKNYQGTQYYKTKEAAEKALEARGKLDLSRTDQAVRVVNKLIKEDPDLATDIRALAQEVYGAAEGATDVLKEQDLERKMRSVATDVTRLQEQLSSKLQGFETKDIARLVLPTGRLAEDILTDITVNTDIGRFGGTAIRNSRMRIISGILNERKGKFNSLRNAVTKFVASGNHLDEVAGIGATYDVAPGYSSFAQSIPEKANLAKRTAIDLDFARLLRQAVLNQEGPKSFQKVKYNTLGEAINAYNKFSREYAKENKIFTPTIEYSPGKELDPSKFAKNYTQLRPEAKANVLELAKKGIGIGVGEARPFEQIIQVVKQNAINKAKKGGPICSIFGMKRGGVAGGGCAEQMEFAFDNAPEQTLNDIGKLNDPKLKTFAQRALSLFSKLGTPGKIAAGAVAGAATLGALTYNRELGEFVNPLNDDKASQGTLTDWIKENPVKTVAGTSLGFAAQEIPGAYKKARELGRGRTRSALGITGALKPVLTTFGTPAMTTLFEVPFAAKRLEEGETMTDVLTDPLGPALGLTFMEPLSRGAGVIRDAPKRTMAEGLRNYFNLQNVGQARPGVTSKILRMGMSPRMIAGASRFLGLPGLALSLGLTGYDAYKNYQNQEGMIYNFFNKDE